MEKVRKVIHNNIEILIVDYSDSRGQSMIEIFDAATQQALEDGKPVLVLNIVNAKTFITPDFMRHVERELKKADHLIEKQAVVGLSTVQKWIIKGMNLWYKKQVHTFDTIEEALSFLAALSKR